MSDASYYAGIIGLHRISIVAQKQRFYTRQAAFNIATRLLYAAGGIQHCRAAFRRNRYHLALPLAAHAAIQNAACAASGILEAAGGFFRGWRLTLLDHHTLPLSKMRVTLVVITSVSAHKAKNTKSTSRVRTQVRKHVITKTTARVDYTRVSL